MELLHQVLHTPGQVLQQIARCVLNMNIPHLVVSVPIQDAPLLQGMEWLTLLVLVKHDKSYSSCR